MEQILCTALKIFVCKFGRQGALIVVAEDADAAKKIMTQNGIRADVFERYQHNLKEIPCEKGTMFEIVSGSYVAI